ncbi:hypothetical protein LXL04_011744 [Taraxacum kok-saghyz]
MKAMVVRAQNPCFSIRHYQSDYAFGCRFYMRLSNCGFCNGKRTPQITILCLNCQIALFHLINNLLFCQNTWKYWDLHCCRLKTVKFRIHKFQIAPSHLVRICVCN